MKILILGSDGYIGYPLTIHLLKLNHEVYGVDNYSRRRRVATLNSNSLTPIDSREIRRQYLKENFKNFLGQSLINLGFDSPTYIKSLLKDIQPDAVVHLAEQPSAPWSMKDTNCASITQRENVIGTLELLWAIKEVCPNTHLLKLGTMGEYGTPDCDIPEGVIPNFCLDEDIARICQLPAPTEKFCPMSGLLFPRTPGSFYHLSKVHDTLNIHFACRNWGLRSTDIMQGVLFGLIGNGEMELTRFDYDEYFGTAINRFCAQAIIEHPLTVYGKGNQTRGFLPLKDSIQCLTIVLEQPPALGEYRTLNQFENIYTINQLAHGVRGAAYDLGLDVEIENIPNPRLEAEDHYYNPAHQKLFDMGYVPTTDIQGEITTLIKQLLPYKDRVIKEAIMPKTKWK